MRLVASIAPPYPLPGRFWNALLESAGLDVLINGIWVSPNCYATSDRLQLEVGDKKRSFILNRADENFRERGGEPISREPDIPAIPWDEQAWRGFRSDNLPTQPVQASRRWRPAPRTG